MKKLRRVCLWIFAALLVLFAIFVTVEHFRGKWELAARLKELQARGEKLTVAELVPPRPSAEQNAAVELVRLMDELGSLDASLCDLPPSLRFTSPGKAVVCSRRNEWPM